MERELTTAGPWTVIATLPANSTSYADTGLAASTQYIYRVRAFNAAGDSAFAGPQAATTRPILSTPVVTVTDAGGVYNGQVFAAVATVKGNTGIPGSSLEGVKPVLTYYVGTTATGTPSSTAPKNAGTYTVNANFPGSANYAAASASATFTITKAKLLVTAKNASKVYGATLPALTASITGFVPGDSSAAVTGSPTLSTLVTATSNVGTYPITATIGSLAAANYTFQFANGALVVSAANTAVALSSSVSGTAAPGQAITFTATVSAVAPGSGTPSGKVQFYVDGNAFGSAVTLSSTGVALSNSSALPPGSHTITAAYISSTTNFNNSNAAAIKQSVGKYTATLSNLSAPTIDRFTPFVTLGGTVTGSNGSVKPTGTVTISAYFNGQLEASHTAAIKSDGSFAAQFLTLLARSGQHTLVYSYSGDANYVATSSTVIATVKTKVDLGEPDKWAGIEQRLNDLLD